MILKKLKLHTSGWLRAFIFMFFTMVMANTATELYFKVHDRLQPTSNYFLYEVGNEINPTSDTFYVNEAPTFTSNVKIFKEVNITWNDTLWCNGLNKKRTQVWQDRVYPNEDKSGTIWAYTEETITKPSVCKLCSRTVAKTERGVEKSQKFCSPDFKFINRN